MTYLGFRIVLVALYGFEALGVQALHAYLKQHVYMKEFMMGIRRGSERIRREVFQRPTPSHQIQQGFEAIHTAGLIWKM